LGIYGIEVRQRRQEQNENDVLRYLFGLLGTSAMDDGISDNLITIDRSASIYYVTLQQWQLFQSTLSSYRQQDRRYIELHGVLVEYLGPMRCDWCLRLTRVLLCCQGSHEQKAEIDLDRELNLYHQEKIT
jgi:hypothetical protein